MPRRRRNSRRSNARRESNSLSLRTLRIHFRLRKALKRRTYMTTSQQQYPTSSLPHNFSKILKRKRNQSSARRKSKTCPLMSYSATLRMKVRNKVWRTKEMRMGRRQLPKKVNLCNRWEQRPKLLCNRKLSKTQLTQVASSATEPWSQTSSSMRNSVSFFLRLRNPSSATPLRPPLPQSKRWTRKT
jgi:hypothetical protein